MGSASPLCISDITVFQIYKPAGDLCHYDVPVDIVIWFDGFLLIRCIATDTKLYFVTAQSNNIMP